MLVFGYEYGICTPSMGVQHMDICILASFMHCTLQKAGRKGSNKSYAYEITGR